MAHDSEPFKTLEDWVRNDPVGTAQFLQHLEDTGDQKFLPEINKWYSEMYHELVCLKGLEECEEIDESHRK
jgi:hypothetical protein